MAVERLKHIPGFNIDRVGRWLRTSSAGGPSYDGRREIERLAGAEGRRHADAGLGAARWLIATCGSCSAMSQWKGSQVLGERVHAALAAAGKHK